VPPGGQQRDALGRDQALVLQKGEDLLLEEALRDVWVHEGDGHEAIVVRPASPGCKGVDVAVWIDTIAEATNLAIPLAAAGISPITTDPATRPS